jgi:hypothetical protein
VWLAAFQHATSALPESLLPRCCCWCSLLQLRASLVAVDGLAAGAVVVGEVTTLQQQPERRSSDNMGSNAVVGEVGEVAAARTTGATLQQHATRNTSIAPRVTKQQRDRSLRCCH